MTEHKWSAVLRATYSESYIWNLLIETQKKKVHRYDSIWLYWFWPGQLKFFLVACMCLCFAFALRTVLLIQGWASYCSVMLAQHQGLCCSSDGPTSEEAGGAEDVGRKHRRDSWPPHQISIPGDGLAPAWWWEIANEFLNLLCLCMKLLLYPLNCL